MHPRLVTILTTLWLLQLGGAVKIRNNSAQVHLEKVQLITTKKHAVGTFLSNLDAPSCSPSTASSLATNLFVRKARGAEAGTSVQHTTKLRVCNAATTARTAILSVYLNGKMLNANAIPQRKCEQFIIPITDSNRVQVKLTGGVVSEWSTMKSHAEMVHIPIMFLVAYVFGHGKGTTFTVNEFHGEDNGLNSVQVAYMDILRSGPPAQLQLISPGGSFQMRGGTFVHVCAGEYDLKFVPEGSTEAVSSNANLVAVAGEQYVVLRLTPEHADGRQSVIAFPTGSDAPWQARLTAWTMAAIATRIALGHYF